MKDPQHNLPAEDCGLHAEDFAEDLFDADLDEADGADEADDSDDEMEPPSSPSTHSSASSNCSLESSPQRLQSPNSE